MTDPRRRSKAGRRWGIAALAVALTAGLTLASLLGGDRGLRVVLANRTDHPFVNVWVSHPDDPTRYGVGRIEPGREAEVYVPRSFAPEIRVDLESPEGEPSHVRSLWSAQGGERPSGKWLGIGDHSLEVRETGDLDLVRRIRNTLGF